MTVYYLRRVIDGAIKIGFTDGTPEDRRRQVENCSGLAIELLTSEPGDRTRERSVQGLFVADRLRGEWFRPTPALIQHVIATAAGR